MKCIYLKLDLRTSPHCLAITELIKLAIGSPTPEKIKNILAIYEDPQHHLLGCVNEDNLIGLIGLQIQKHYGIIKHIAVLKSFQKQGIGKDLIAEAIKGVLGKWMKIEGKYC